LHKVNRSEIAQYLKNALESIKNDNYRIDLNIHRQKNINLYTDYIIDEQLSKKILLSLEVSDFTEKLDNDHVGREYEKLYVFEKKVKLVERFGSGEKLVPLYIKMRQRDDGLVIVISFHEEMYPQQHPFQTQRLSRRLKT